MFSATEMEIYFLAIARPRTISVMTSKWVYVGFQSLVKSGMAISIVKKECDMG